MGGLFEHGAIAKSLGYFDSSRPGAAGPFDKLFKGGENMTPAQRKAFLAREAAKKPSGSGLQAKTPLTSLYS